MTHLSVEDIIFYVTATTPDSETLAHIGKVNAHVLSCESCREKLEAFQVVNKGLSSLKDSSTETEKQQVVNTL